jgi:uncharacterized repeat protein (TIGR01451 family)
LGITLTHQGDFTQGEQNAIYTVRVANASGQGTTSGMVTVTETLPSGLTLVSMAGPGWNCTVLPTCTRSDALTGGSGYPSITVTVNVLANATSPQVNAVAVSGGGSAPANATDSTIILTEPTLHIQKSHIGSFVQGQQNVNFTLIVSNAVGAASTSGTVVVTETVPSGLVLVSMAGTGWNCAVLPSCTRSDALAGGSGYPSITVTVNVLANATSPQVNAVAVSGGGSAPANAVDKAVIVPPNWSSSNSIGIITAPVAGQTVDKAYVALTYQSSVAVINADSTSSLTSLITTIALPAGYQPSETAANQATLQVVVISFKSADIQIIDASSDNLIATVTTPATQIAGFGRPCIVCGVLFDPTTNQVILDTSQGYMLLDPSALTLSALNASALAAENFAFDPGARLILSPTYSFSSPSFTGLQVLNLNTDSVFNFGSSVGNQPDSAALDFNTEVAVVPDERTTNQYIINLQGAFSGGFTAPTSVFSIGFTTCSNQWTIVAAQSVSHLLALATEPDNCIAVETMPTGPIAGAPDAPSTFHWGHMPLRPDGVAWTNDPVDHGITVFSSVVDTKTYSLLTDLSQLWMARVDMAGVRDAALKAGGNTNEVDLTPFVFFLSTQ